MGDLLNEEGCEGERKALQHQQIALAALERESSICILIDACEVIQPATTSRLNIMQSVCCLHVRGVSIALSHALTQILE